MKKHIDQILTKLKNIIRFAKVTLVGGDDKQFPESQYEYMGKVKDVVVVYPYGMSAKAPVENLAVLLTVGHEENSVSIEMSEGTREKGLKAGEAVFGNWVSGSNIKFLANGDIEVTSNGNVNVTASGTVNVTASSTIVNGNLTVNGNITSSGIIQGVTVIGAAVQGGTLSAGGLDMGTHTHGGVETGSASTGPPQ